MTVMGEGGELSERERTRIAGEFVLHAPPGEFNEVFNDVRVLLNSDRTLKEGCAPAFAQYSKDQMAVVRVDGATAPVLITEHNDLGNGRFYDPRSGLAFKYDHLRKEASDPAAHPCPAPNAEAWRKALQAQADEYANSHYQVLVCPHPCPAPNAEAWRKALQAQADEYANSHYQVLVCPHPCPAPNAEAWRKALQAQADEYANSHYQVLVCPHPCPAPNAEAWRKALQAQADEYANSHYQVLVCPHPCPAPNAETWRKALQAQADEYANSHYQVLVCPHREAECKSFRIYQYGLRGSKSVCPSRLGRTFGDVGWLQITDKTGSVSGVGSVAVFASEEGGRPRLTLCIQSSQLQPKNYSNGRWRSEWSVLLSGEKSVEVKGSIRVQVHYYEDGNVQLVSSKQIARSVAVGDETATARAIIKVGLYFHITSTLLASNTSLWLRRREAKYEVRSSGYESNLVLKIDHLLRYIGRRGLRRQSESEWVSA